MRPCSSRVRVYSTIVSSGTGRLMTEAVRSLAKSLKPVPFTLRGQVSDQSASRAVMLTVSPGAACDASVCRGSGSSASSKPVFGRS